MKNISLESTDVEVSLRSGETITIDLVETEIMLEQLESKLKDTEGDLTEKGSELTQLFQDKFAKTHNLGEFSFSEAWLLLQHVRAEYIELKKT